MCQHKPGVWLSSWLGAPRDGPLSRARGSKSWSREPQRGGGNARPRWTRRAATRGCGSWTSSRRRSADAGMSARRRRRLQGAIWEVGQRWPSRTRAVLRMCMDSAVHLVPAARRDDCASALMLEHIGMSSETPCDTIAVEPLASAFERPTFRILIASWSNERRYEKPVYLSKPPAYSPARPELQAVFELPPRLGQPPAHGAFCRGVGRRGQASLGI